MDPLVIAFLGKSPSIERVLTVLPDPLSPIIETVCPHGISKETLSTTKLS